ncbi:MAG TPA: MATE family efflux transporter [Clostridiaceae bacterium]|nr:MATE family efflux transporter [Clostridiaceae bacterium]
MGKIQNKKIDIVNGPVVQVLFAVAVPLMINNMIMSLYNLADGLWIAQVSLVDFSATSFIWPPHFLFVSLGMGISMAGISIISQLIGAGNHDRAESYATHVFYFCLGVGIFCSILAVVLAPTIIGWMGATGLLAERSITYFSIIMVSYFFEMIYLAFYAILGAQGKTRVVTQISLITSVVNVVLDPLFIFETVPIVGIKGLNMGIAGAAWATVLSQFLRVVLGIGAMRSKDNEIVLRLRKVKLTSKQFIEIGRAGFPTALGQSSTALGFTLMNSIVVSCGQATLAAYASVNRVSGFLLQPAQGIGNALTPLVGQNLGAGQGERVKKFNRAAFKAITIITVASGILLIVLRHSLLNLFIRESGEDAALVWSLALEYVYYIAVMTPAMGFFGAFSGIFIGAGYHRYSAFLSIMRLWGLRLPIVLSLQNIFNLGATGIWIAMLASNMLLIPIELRLYYKGKWFTSPRINH